MKQLLKVATPVFALAALGLLGGTAHAGRNTGQTPTGDSDDSVPCPTGYEARGSECWMKMDGAGNWISDWDDGCGCVPPPPPGSGSGGSGGPGNSGGAGGTGGGIDIIGCGVRVVAAGAGWTTCVLSTPTGVGPAVTCFAAAMTSMDAARVCTGSAP